MKFYILTSSLFKKNEISKYFLNVGIKTIWIKSIDEIEENIDYFLIQEQTQLLNQHSKKPSLDCVERCTHFSNIKVTIKKEKNITVKNYSASFEGFIFPSLKNKNKKDVYNWDDIFVSSNSGLSNQQLKENGIKNSARDIAFSKMTDDLNNFFILEKQMNLNFNPVKDDAVVNFEPIIYQLLSNNEFYKLAYNNSFFRPILNKALNNGIFVRKAKIRSDRNYWLPGINAGIPLTPKKDNIHEITFMFHDIMHFLFPDFLMTGNTHKDKNIYIISRMMSEAFTIILADYFFIDILHKSGVDYDFTKRKIYPLFEKLNIDISTSSLKDIKEILYKNSLFVLFGEEKLLREITNNSAAFENYKAKYQPFFREDYIWTNNNALHFKNYHEINQKWEDYIKLYNINDLQTTSLFNCKDSPIDIFNAVFEYFFNIIEDAINKKEEYSPHIAYKNSYKRYISGQLMAFFNFKSVQNSLFLHEIENNIAKLNSSDNLEEIKLICKTINDIYSIYIDSLVEANIINKYKGDQYKNIYPMFEPFYVFYDKKENQSFFDVINNIFEG